MNFGWFLPYHPHKREFGAWKLHYIDCILSISAFPLGKVCFGIWGFWEIYDLLTYAVFKNDATNFREVIYRRELTDNEKEYSISKTKKRLLNGSESGRILSLFKFSLVKRNCFGSSGYFELPKAVDAVCEEAARFK